MGFHKTAITNAATNIKHSANKANHICKVFTTLGHDEVI